MSVSNHQQLDAPSGMATAIDRTSLPESRAQYIEGFRPARLGVMQLAPLLKRLRSAWPSTASINGTAIWLSSDGQYDTMLVMSSGTLYSIRLFYKSGVLPAFNYDERQDCPHSYIELGSRTDLGLTSFGSTARINASLMFDTELILSIDGTLFRYYRSEVDGTETFKALGLTAGGAPALSATTGGSMTPSETYSYIWTFVDEFGRESSPSAATSVTLSSLQNAVQVTRGSGTTGGTTGITHWNIYRLNPGADTYNYVTQVVVGTTAYTDTADDNTVAAGDPAPEDGENDKPNAAKIMVYWKNRLVLNDQTDPAYIQISNAGSPTQFSSIALPTNVNDGLRVLVGGSGDNEVTGLANLGSLLSIFKRQTISFLYGDDITDFQIRPVHERGCQNPNSVQRCENVIFFLSDDGVYSLGYENGYALKKVSTEIDNLFHGFTSVRTDEPTSYGQPKSVQVLSSAQANVNSFYFNNVYYLSFGNKTLGYDFIANGWFDTGWGFVKTSSTYLSQSSLTSLVGCPGTVYLTIADINTTATEFHYYTVADTPGDIDAPATTNARILTRCFDGDGPPINRRKRAKRFSIYGDSKRPKGTVIGTLTGYADGQAMESYPIYAGYCIDAPNALYQQEWSPLMTGYELYFELAFTDTSISLNHTRLEYGFLN